MNALLFCPDVMKIDTLYVTASPCLLCIRALMNTNCQRVVYKEVYSLEALNWWTSRGRTADILEHATEMAQFAYQAGIREGLEKAAKLIESCRDPGWKETAQFIRDLAP